MREIKFRIWQLDKFIYSDDLTYIGLENKSKNLEIFEKLGFLFSSRGKEKNIDKFIIQQFTGLLDKNGKEIYEGDILQNPLKERKTVVFNNGCFSVSPNTLNNKNEFVLYAWFPFNREIIGNIHENPELFKNNEKNT